MYFDAVLDSMTKPLFNGTPEEVKKWLKGNETDETTRVCIGKTMELVTVPEYLRR